MDNKDVLGLTVADAKKLCEENDLILRVTMEDDKYFAVTMDFNPKRLNIGVREGLVVSVSGRK